MADLKELDPVQGLVDYVLDIKPYHTKIVEVLVEYVSNEPVDVTILDTSEMEICVQNPPGFFDENGVLQPGSLLEEGTTFSFNCGVGFDTSGFSNGQLLITSPNPGISFSAFPAINSALKTFTINGNVTTDVKIGDELTLSSTKEDLANIHSISGINDGPAGSASFVVLGDQTGQFVPLYTFTAINAGTNNGTYTTTSSSYSAGPDETTILVEQSIGSSGTGGIIGVQVTAGDHNGLFTVTSVEFNGGSIDSLTDPLDILTLTLGNDPHTIITVAETLNPIPALGASESYVVIVVLDPIEIETVLSYSRAQQIYDPSGPTYTQEPDEGTNRTTVLNVTSSSFTIAGDLRTSNVFAGDAIKIDTSTGNNGTYTITTITYAAGPDETTLGVVEPVVSATIDGYATIIIPANVFFVDEDRTSQFTQGRRFDVIGGSFESTYTILRSDFTQGKTRVRVAESIFEPDSGSTIVGTTGGFVVPGDQTSVFIAGLPFNVIFSPQNDGAYVVDVGGTTFDSGTGLSTITVADTLDSTPGGTLHVALTGTFSQHHFGFDENSPLCGSVPDTILLVYIQDNLKFTGMGLELTDDLIVYNLENTDRGGFEFPVDTIVETTQPAVPLQLTAPVAPAILDLWYDTTRNIFRQWNGLEWNDIKTANWFDTSVNMLYYRTFDKFVDTGWVLDSIRFPGYDNNFPAIGETEQIDSQLFSSSAVSPGVPETSFTLDTAVPGSDATLLKVTINGIPAGFTLDTANDFTVTSPPITIGDIVEAKVFDRTRTETNAHVTEFDVQPHLVLHTTVTTDVPNDAYVVAGGNFIERFVSFNTFTVFDTTLPNAKLGTQNTTSLPITDVDDVAGTITIGGDYTWLFTSGRIFRVNPSSRNYNDFQVQSSAYDGGTDATTIIVLPTPFESTNDDTDATQQYFYNPPSSVLTIDETTETITVPGNVVTTFAVGLEILIENSTIGNNAVWTVSTATYDGGNDRTDIVVTGNIPDADVTGNATIRTPIFQNYSKDLGVIIGAIYDPSPGGVYATNQPKTIVLPSTTVLSASVNTIEYTWIGPVRFDMMNAHRDTMFAQSFTDSLLLENELTGAALNTLIYDTDATANTFTIRYTDPVSSDPASLTDRFTPGTIFSVVGSYGTGSPPDAESNDALYIVLSSSFDGTDTTIIIETDYDQIPPYNSFTVVSVSNNDGPPDNLSTIELLGDHVNLFQSFVTPTFRLDQPILSATPLENVMDVSNIELIGGNTVLTIDNDFIDEAFTGAIGIIEVVYRGNIYFDNQLPAATGQGSVIISGSTAATLTAAVFTDDLMFGWGDVLRWYITGVDFAGSTVDLLGDFTAVIHPNDPFSIIGSQNIDGDYEAVSTTYDGPSDTSTVVVANPIIPADPPVSNINVTIISADSTGNFFIIDGEDGKHNTFLLPTTTFDVVGSLTNDATYTIVSATYSSGNDTLQLNVANVPTDDDSGDVQYQKKLAGQLEMSGIDVTPWFQYNIIEIRPASSNILIDGNVIGDVQSGQEINILGTTFNNSIVTTSGTPTFDAGTNTSLVPITEPLSYGTNEIVLLPDNTIIKALGNVALFLQGGDTFSIINSTGNDGAYVVLGVSFDGAYSFITITTTLPDLTPDGDVQFNERGGWIESVRYQGISLRFEDVLFAAVEENADATLLLSSGSLVDAFDYNYFDVGSFDEELGTLIHLYSNTF